MPYYRNEDYFLIQEEDIVKAAKELTEGMEMKSFTLPDLGEGLAESEIIEWHVDAGDTVELDQVVLTVETAKATVEVPAPYSGTIIRRFGNAGDVISIGSLLLEIEEKNHR